MLKTNYNVAGRQLYEDDDLNYLVILPNLAQGLGRTPFGTFKYSMTIRLAGRINPDVPTKSLNMVVDDVRDNGERPDSRASSVA